jgi:hypothetical protein
VTCREDGTAELKAVVPKAPRVYTSKIMQWLMKGEQIATHGLRVDVHQVVDEDQFLHDMYERAEVFDAKSEYAYSWLQVKHSAQVRFMRTSLSSFTV